MNKKMSLINILILLLSGYLIITFALYFFQRNLLYYPSVNNYSGEELDVSVEKVKIKTEDDIELLSWYHNKDSENYKTILFLHGNAGTLENRIYKINHLKNMNVNFLIIAWRGFSGNKGKPTEKGLYEDAKSAIRWLKNKGIKEENIIIYGESLGTGVVIELAQKKLYKSVILEAPFTSIPDVAQKMYPIYPVKYLTWDKFDNLSKINNLISPLLVLHGKKDEVVPFKMGKKIFEKYNNKKDNVFIDEAMHNNLYEYGIAKDIMEFINKN